MAGNIGMKYVASADTSQFKSEMEQMKSSTGNVKKELAVTTKEIMQMQLALSKMSDEEKNSDFGQHLQGEINKAMQAAAQLKDIQADVQQNINQLASDTAIWDGVAEGIGVIRDSVSAFAASMGVATDEGSVLGESLNLLARAQAYANAAITIGTALQKQSKLMSAITTIQKKAEAAAVALSTKAKVGETTATKGATIAQAAFNAVAQLNPYVLLATAVLGVGAALVGYASYSKKAREEEEKMQRATEEATKKAEEQKKRLGDLGSTVGSAIAKFTQLKTTWQSLKTVAEKTQFLKDNKTAFDQLGLSINNVKTAEDIFVNNTKKVVQAIIARAVAEKTAEQAAEKLIELRKKKEEAGYNSATGKTGYTYTPATESNITDEERRAVGIGTHTTQVVNQNPSMTAPLATATMTISAWDIATQEQLDKITEMRKKKAAAEAQATIDGLNQQEEAITKEVEDTTKAVISATKGLQQLGDIPVTPTTPNTPKNTPAPTAETVTDAANPGSARWYKEMISKLQKDLENTPIEFDGKLNPDYTQIEQEIDKIKKEYESKFESFKVTPQLQAVADKSLSDVMKPKASAQFEPDDTIGMTSEEIEYNAKINGLEELRQTIDALEELITEKQQAANEIASAGGADTEIYTTLTDQINELGDAYEEVANKAGILVESINESRKSIANVAKTSQNLSDISDAVGSLGNSFSSLGDAFDSKELNVAGIIAGAIANILGGFASASSQAASMTPFGWMAFTLAGLAQVTAVIAQVKNLSKNAGGGILSGPTSVGDQTLFWGNSGEMVFNKQEQSRLFNALKYGTVSYDAQKDSTVEFKIRGKNLVGTQKNYYKQRAHI